jgi:hypothetical protein
VTHPNQPVHSVKEQLFNYIVLCFIKLQILARISSFALLRSQYKFCSGLKTCKFWQILIILLNISVFTRFRISSHRLQIERGRYQDALRQDRLYLRCTSGETDDEKHFLISCSTCPVIRTEMFGRYNIKYLSHTIYREKRLVNYYIYYYYPFGCVTSCLEQEN